MRAIRLGNDVPFEWTIRGLDDVSGEKVVQLYNMHRSNPETFTYQINGNVVSGMFRGKDQVDTGVYRLLLQVNRGQNGMVTLDKVNAFSLHDVCDFGVVQGEDDEPLQTDVVVLETETFLTIPSTQQQVQSDWNESNSGALSFIRHKPTIPDVSGFIDSSTVRHIVSMTQSDYSQITPDSNTLYLIIEP